MRADIRRIRESIDKLSVEELKPRNCISCKRTLVWDEMFHNGYTDGPVLCHLCKQARNEVLNEELRNMEPSDEN